MRPFLDAGLRVSGVVRAVPRFAVEEPGYDAPSPGVSTPPPPVEVELDLDGGPALASLVGNDAAPLRLRLHDGASCDPALIGAPIPSMHLTRLDAVAVGAGRVHAAAVLAGATPLDVAGRVAVLALGEEAVACAILPTSARPVMRGPREQAAATGYGCDLMEISVGLGTEDWDRDGRCLVRCRRADDAAMLFPRCPAESGGPAGSPG
jgi:hypothetical protein